MKLSLSILSVMLLSIATSTTYSHCQIPCGIYDDHARIKAMLEDTETVRKAVHKIETLSGQKDAQSNNQLVRWIMNKEKHAQSIISTMSDYFMTQRIKPTQKDYSERLIKHHAVILNAMHVKQGVESKKVGKLEAAIQSLFKYYPEHKH